MSKYKSNDDPYLMNILVDKNQNCECKDSGEGGESICNFNSGDEIILLYYDNLLLVSELSPSAPEICKMPKYTTAEFISTQTYENHLYMKIKVIGSGQSSCEGKTGWTIEGYGSQCYFGKTIGLVVENPENYVESQHGDIFCKDLVLCNALWGMPADYFSCSEIAGATKVQNYNRVLREAYETYCGFGEYAGLQCITNGDVRTFSCQAIPV